MKRERLTATKKPKAKKKKRREKMVVALRRLDEQLIERFCRLIREGLGFEAACDYLSIPHSTFWMWKRKGDLYFEGGGDVQELELFGKFVQDIRKAYSTFLRETTLNLKLDDSKTWTKWCTILERRDRNNWGRSESANQHQEIYAPDERFL